MNFGCIRKTAAVALGLTLLIAAPALAQNDDPGGAVQAGGVNANADGRLEMDMGQAVAYALGQNQTLESAK